MGAREHAHRTREARDECGRGRCDGDVRHDSEPFDGAAPQKVQDDERGALRRLLWDYLGIIEADGEEMDAFIDSILATLAPYRQHPLPDQGSCWDEAPSVRLPSGQCAPMPLLCELRAGHLGAHRRGLSEWMHGRKQPDPEVSITIRHDGGNTLTGTVEQVLSTHLAKGWALE